MTRHALVVHEEGKPYVRLVYPKNWGELRIELARTHKRLLKRGYAVTRKREKGEQRVLTYTYIKTMDPTRKDIHVVVLDE